MNTDVAIGLIGGFLLGGVIAGVWIGTIAHANYEKYMSMKETAFGLEGLLLDCYEGNADKMWRMRSDGVDVVVERGRPDVRTRASSALSEQRAVVYDDPDGPPQVISLTDVDDLPEWGDKHE